MFNVPPRVLSRGDIRFIEESGVREGNVINSFIHRVQDFKTPSRYPQNDSQRPYYDAELVNEGSRLIKATTRQLERIEFNEVT